MATDFGAVTGAAVLSGVTPTAAVLAGLAVTLGLAARGAYRSRLSYSAIDGFGRLVALVCAVTVLVSGTTSATQTIVTTALVACAAALALRFVVFVVVRSARRRGALQRTSLILDCGPHGPGLVRAMREHPEYGLSPIGYLDNPSFDDVPVVGTVDGVYDALADEALGSVIVREGSTKDPDIAHIVAAADYRGVHVFVLSEEKVAGAVRSSDHIEALWGYPLARVQGSVRQPAARRRKRAFDIGVALVVIGVTLPLMLIASLAVRLSGPGPLLFRQRRLGENRRPFDIVKFRSLPPHRDSDRTWGIGDQQPGPIGRLLRKSSLDELPQFFSVLRGDMSVVGPRPERPHFVTRFTAEIPRYADRHRCPVGITGWAQVHDLRGDTSIEDRVRFDNYYIEHWSFWGDLRIVILTFPCVVRTLLRSVSLARPGQHPVVDRGVPTPYISAVAREVAGRE